MIDVDALVAFITARLDEDEAIAQSASPGPWRWAHLAPGSKAKLALVSGDWSLPGSGIVVPVHNADVNPSVHDARHITCHDPTRILRDVASTRLLLAFLDPIDMPAGEGRFVAERVLQVLAMRWDAHPDYDPTWRPS